MSRSRFHFVALSLVGLSLGWVGRSSAQQAAAPQAADKASNPVYLDEPPPAPKPSIVGEIPVVEKYDDGKVRVERAVRKMSDDSIMNHGKFTEYYRDGKKFSEGTFKEGVQDGQWSYWHDNGQLCKTVTFIKGQPDGAWDSFRADGTLQSKKSYKDGKRNGLWVAYFEDGKTPSIEQTYVDNKLDGLVKLYFKNGKPRIETVFKGGMREGQSTEWEESGRKVAEATYVKNKLDGKLTRYNPDGTKTEEYFRDGKRVQSPTAPPA
jgi:antitoxin component YwqK of YwqJK toxin-antitoxin module